VLCCAVCVLLLRLHAVTDIQSSTTLWEALPAGVMDRALAQHHRIIRSLLSKHRGYESATEVGLASDRNPIMV
jgi:class 3 adenylate cyclase